MTKRNFIYIIRWLLFLGVISLLLGVTRLMTNPADHSSDLKEDAVNLAYTLENKSLLMPPIDAAAPSVFETATFGLG